MPPSGLGAAGDSQDVLSPDRSPLTATNAGQGGEETGKAATSGAALDLDFQDLSLENMSQILEMRRGVMHFRVVFAEMDWLEMSSARIQARTFLKEKVRKIGYLSLMFTTMCRNKRS